MALSLLIGGIEHIALLVAESLRVEQRADSFVSTCSFQLLDEDSVLVVVEKDSVVIEDGAERYFAGIVANVTIANMADGTESRLFTLECQDYNIRVEEVVIDQLEEYGGAQDDVIIDDLFDKYLPEINSEPVASGGFVQHLHVFGEIDFADITLREALDRICSEVESTALEGYWYIDYDNNKYLHYFNVEDNAPAWWLSNAPDYVNSWPYFAAVRKERQGSAIINRILVIGAEFGLFVQDYDSYAYYGAWYESVVRDNTLFTVSELIDHGNSLLAKWAYPDETYEVTIRKTGLRAGMNVRLECPMLGTRIRTNEILNPSFEANVVDGWTFTQDGAGGSAAQSVAHVSVGTQSCLLVASDAGHAVMTSDDITLEAGETLSVQVRMYREANPTSDIRITTTGGVERAVLASSLQNAWEFLALSWTNDTGAPIAAQLQIRNSEGDGTAQLWFDACMAEIDKGPSPQIYVDGTLAYCHWSGAANNSPSYRDPVFMIKQLEITWPQNTITYKLTLGGTVSPTALIRARLSDDRTRRGLGPVVPGQLPLSSVGWFHDLTFTALDDNTVQWTGGTITTAAAETFTINAGNTGDMAAATVYYVYLDTDTSLVNLQTAAAATVGRNIILIAVCAPAADGTEAKFQVFGGGDGDIGVFITADNIAADTITANEIAANTITAAQVAAETITANEIAANTITGDRIAANTITADKLTIGEFLFDKTYGLLVLGPYGYLSETEWRSSRKQKATMSGALHQVQGAWLGARGLIVEEATTNLEINPSMEAGDPPTGYSNYYTPLSRSRDSTYALFGEYSQKVVCDPASGKNDGVLDDIGAGSLVNGETYTFSAWVKCEEAVQLKLVMTRGVLANATMVIDGPTNGWVRLWATAVFDDTSYNYIRCAIIENLDEGATFYTDGWQLEHGDHPTSYCDGSLGYGYAWTGAANASTSTRAATEINLDDLVGLISDNDSVSYRVVAQMPYDTDADWPVEVSCLMDATKNDFSERVLIYYSPAADKIRVFFVDGATNFYLDSEVQTFSAGAWLDIVVTCDYTTDEYRLYINGILQDTDTTDISAPAIQQWNLGSYYDGSNQSGAGICEFGVFDKILTQVEISALYELQRPLVDTGSLETPGIYIMDGKFRIASSATGQRMEITPEGIGAYNTDEDSVVIDPDGIDIDVGTDLISQIRWTDSGTTRGQIYSYIAGGTQPRLQVISGPSAINTAISELYLRAAPHTDYIGRDTYIRIYSMYSVTHYGAVEIVSDGVLALECGKYGTAGFAKSGSLRLVDGITAPPTLGGIASIYVDAADGDLKVKFGNGFVAVIAADS